MRRGTQCSMDECEKPVWSRGWCRAHYKRWWLYGDPDVIYTTQGLSPEERFWLKVEKTDTCWLWTAGLDGGGYGQWNPRGGQRQTKAHRYAYELLVGPIPDGMQLDHLCHSRDLWCEDNPCIHRRCVNPEHLEPVTPQVNTLRGNTFQSRNAVKLFCVNGHRYDAENTYWLPNGKGRACRACGREKMRRRRAAAKSDGVTLL